MGFEKFNYDPNYLYDKGWDKYALDYQYLLEKDTVYYLTKELIHYIIDKETKSTKNIDFTVLDLNCGTGNDFPFFFERGWNVVGCDGSAGMLNKAYEKYSKQLQSHQLSLFQGMIETISENDFHSQKFDLIFSVTGGFSYVNDEHLRSINQTLSSFLKPGGKIVLAHLNLFCLPEFLHRVYRLKNPFLRLRKTIKVKIKDEHHTMYLRSPSQLKKMYTPYFEDLRTRPLMALTPPYQTGFKPSKNTLKKLRKWELKLIQKQSLAWIADQVVVTGEKKQIL